MKKCRSCPECGSNEYTHKDYLGYGFRMCWICGQEWWTDIDYEYHINKTPLHKFILECDQQLNDMIDKLSDKLDIQILELKYGKGYYDNFINSVIEEVEQL